MTCRRAFEVDLVGCLVDSTRPEWAAFRDHYPRCPDCAAEVRAWTELQGGLGAPHPSPEALLRHDQSGDRAIAAHVAACATCRDELVALRAFDPTRLAAPAPARRRWAWIPGLRDVVLHPAFAYAMVVALLYPATAPWWRGVGAPAEQARKPVAFRAEPAVEAPRHDEIAEARREREAPAPAGLAGASADRPAQRAPKARAAAPLRTLEEDRAVASSALRLDDVAKASAPIVVLTPSAETTLRPTGDVVLLRVPVPSGGRATALRIVEAGGRREIVVRSPDSSAGAAIRVPTAWLTPGDYRVEVVLADRRPAVTARLRVEP